MSADLFLFFLNLFLLGSLSSKATVPLDLFRKQPSGQQSFALNSTASESSPELGPRLGSISAEVWPGDVFRVDL